LLAFYFFLKLLLGVGLFFTALRLKFNLRKFIAVFLTSVTLQALLGIWQFFQQSTFVNKWLGLSAHPAWQGGVSVIENSSGRWLRAYGGLPHPNILGGLLASALIIGLGFYLKTGRKNTLWKMFLLGSLAINFPALLLTFSRSAWLSFLIGLILLVIYFIKNKTQDLSKKFTLPLLIFIFLFLAFLNLFSNIFTPRLTSSTRLERKSVNERIIYLQEAKQIIREHFLPGVGAGNYIQKLRQVKSSSAKQTWQYQPVHNVFLLVFAELGIIGFSLFLIIIFFILRKFSYFFKNKKTDNFIFLSVFISFLPALLFDHWLWTTHFGLLFFWLIAGLIIRKPSNYSKRYTQNYH